MLNCCKLQVVFQNKTRLGNNFYFKDWILKDLTSGVPFKFKCELCNELYYGECVRHLNVRIGEKFGISPFIKNHVKPTNCTVTHPLLLCNDSACYDNFSIVMRKSKTFLL